MAQDLAGKKIAVVATDGFEQVELLEPRRALMEAGATVHIVAPHEGTIQGFQHLDKGQKVTVDKSIDHARPDHYDALVLPGGVANPDQLRMQPKVVSFVRSFFDAHKPVGVICHGPWTLIEADVVKGRKITSWPSLKTDLRNAGADWVDQEVVTDNGLVSSRKPDDLPAFCRKIVEAFKEGRHQQPHAAE
jgi:protease I